MCANLQPDIDAKIGQRANRRRELHRLPDPAPPMGGVTLSAKMPTSGHGAKERNRFFKWHQIRQARLQLLGGWLHQRMMERVIHAHKTGENVLSLQFPGDCFK